METLFFILGIASVVIIAIAIVAVISIVKVIKLQSKLKNTITSFNLENQKISILIRNRFEDAERKIYNTERGIESRLDSRLDKLISKFEKGIEQTRS